MDQPEEDATGVDECSFDFSMSRRMFMGSTGAASALLGAGAATAEPQTHDVDLLFNMDPGNNVLNLTIVTEAGADAKPTWSIHRRVFGLPATFSLRSRRIALSEATGMVPRQPSYILDVLGFTHATQVPRGLSFWFFQKMTDGFRKWHIRAETDFFSRDGTWNSFQMGAQGRGPNRREANAVPLRSFAESAANKGVALKQIISRARINDTLLRIANGMLRGGDDMELSLTSKGVWLLARLGRRPGLVGPGEGMAPDKIMLSFPEPPQDGEAEGFRGMVISGIYDGKTESRMVLGRANGAGATALTLRGGELELRCAEAALAQAAVIGEWTVSHQAGGLTTGGFTCPKARLICARHGRDGEIQVRFEGDPRSQQPVPWVDTPIGRLRLTGSGAAPSPEPSGQVADKFATRRDSAIRAHGVRRPNGSSELVWFEAGLLLSESALALGGQVDHSRLRFADAAITLWHSDRPEAPRGSFVRLGRAPQGSLLARLDLSRAELEAARASDMVSLKFRFAGLALEFLPGTPPELVNALQSCGPVALERVQDTAASDAPAQPLPQALDDRPTLIVEWPPQHVMEQALFLPNPPPLPDVRLNDRAALVRLVRRDDGWTVAEVPRQQAQDWVDPDSAGAVESLMDRLPSQDERIDARRAIAEAKMARERESRNGDAFTRFHLAFAERFDSRGRQHRPPRDQRIYIGDMALDPYSRIRARRLQKQMAAEVIAPFVNDMLKNVQAQARLLWDDPRFAGHDKDDIDAALRLEEQLQSAVPMYQLLRSYYRRERLKALAASGGEATPLQVEYLLADPDRPRAWPKDEHGPIKEQFIKDGLGGDKPEGEMRARLSAPSRLAFHVDCADTIARARVEVIRPLAPIQRAGPGQSRPPSDPDEDAALLSGRNRRAWTFEALTDWSGMEPRVTSRADNVYRSTRGGLLGASSRSMDLSSGARLDQLGFSFGDFVPAGLRMAEVAASLVQPPGPLETEIVIPARLSLSPSREAVFLPTRPAEAAIFHQPEVQGDAARTCPWPGCGSGRDLAHEREPGFAPAFVPLWRVRLDVDAAPPGLRVVHSPDLRPEALLGSLHEPREPKSKIRFPGGGPPPLGDLAPWLLGREETHAGLPDVSDLSQAMDEHTLADPTALTELHDLKDGICAYLKKDPRPADRPRLLNYLCRRLGLRQSSKGRSSPDPLFFRTSLSANDRHQLVLLSSAWGLPSLGDSGVGSGKEATRLVPESRHDIADLMPGAMLYNPAALSVQELVLTAMGGCLRHDSAFSPPVSPFHVSGRRLYDALSVERWQHWIQLGRDVRAEVVYKGYLYPIGHQAALVKLTERCFRRDEESGVIRAYLRQRLFIRVSQPDKPFPAAAQPCNARRFPLRRMSVLTRETPDLADPLLVQPMNTDRVQVLPGGRVVLGNRIGLVFWPSLGMAAGSELRFALSCDGAPSRMPLLFVDNTAANDAEVLAQLAAYYNGMSGSAADLRTMPLSGRKLRYAPELRSEQASYDTDAWVLGVEGKSSGLHVISASPAVDAGISLETYEFKHDNFNFTPDLQAADQPPFYPVVETARIVLRQSERLTGQSLGAKAASFDGHYVAEGLPQPGDEASAGQGEAAAGGDAALEALAKARGNEMQIVMVLRDQPEQSMNSSGDRSGGIARPGGTIVALSRNKGPVTAANSITIPSLPLSSLPSLALAHTSISGTSAPRASSSDPRRTIAEIRGGLMSSDAKLFGIVKLSDILKAATGKPGSRAPELVEGLFFGVVGGEDGAQEKDNRSVDKTEWLRQTVLRPLRAGVALSIEEWNALELKAAAAQDERFAKPMTLAELFGPLDQGLRALLAAVDAALAEQDTILLALKLGAVFETGRRLLDAVAELAARPLERVEIAVQERLDDLRRLFADGLLPALSLETWAGLVAGDLKTWLIVALVPDEAALGDLLAFAGGTVKFPKGSVEGFRKILLDHADSDQLRTALRDWMRANWLREEMQEPADFAGLTQDQAVFDALIDRRLALAQRVVADAEALKQALETKPPDMGEAARRAAALLRPFVGNAALVEEVGDIAGKLGDMVNSGSIQTDALALLRQLSPAAAWPEDWAKVSAGRIEVFRKTLPKLDIKNPQVLSVYLADMALYLRLWQAHVEEVLQIAGSIAVAIETTADTSPEQAGQAVAVLSGLCDMLSKALASTLPALSVRWPDRPLPSKRSMDELKSDVGKTSDGFQAVKALLDGSGNDIDLQKLKSLKYNGDGVLKQFSAEGLLGQFSKDYLDLACLLLDLIAWAQGICPRVPDRLMQALDPVAQAALSTMLGDSGKTLRDLYVELSASLEKLEQDPGIDARLRHIISQAMDAPPRPVLQAAETSPDLPKPRTRLEQDIQYLDPERPSPVSENREFFAVFLEEWAAMQSTPLVIARTLEAAFADTIRSEIVQLFDLGALRDRIEDHIQRILPTAVELRYAIDTDLSNFGQEPSAIFIPAHDCRLTVTSVARIALGVSGDGISMQFRCDGSIGAFDIKLVGEFEAVALKFHGADFSVDRNGSVSFNPRFNRVEILSALSFVKFFEFIFKALPVKIERRKAGPGLNAVYRQTISYLELLGISLYNMDLSIGAELPFDGDEALFTLALGARSNPVTIGVAPFYGGSIYVAICANALGIRGFDVSFEWGATRPFEFGPLSGIGRVMVGIYIRQRQVKDSTQTSIYGTFFAGGTGAISSFTVAASLYVRLGAVDDGAMEGEATFTYSFSLGVFDVSFSVAVHHHQPKPQDKEKEEAKVPPPKKSMLGRPYHVAGPATASGDASAPFIETDIRSPQRDWARFRRYFVNNGSVAEGFWP